MIREPKLIEAVARKLAGQYMIDDGYGEQSRASAEDGEMWRNFRAMAVLAIATVYELAPEVDPAGSNL